MKYRTSLNELEMQGELIEAHDKRKMYLMP